MSRGTCRFVALARVCLVACWAPMVAIMSGAAALADEPARIVRGAVDLACAARGRDDLERLGNRLVGGRPSSRPTVTRLAWGRRWTYPVADGRLIMDWIWPRGELPYIKVEYDGAQGSRPEVLAIVDHRCTLRAARRLLYDADGVAAWLEDLDDALQPNGHRESLNPPVPAHPDPGGLPVAIIDTGVNYLLPEINRRLARDPSGALLGYDFWDLDERPFDVHPRRSAFYPDRHGTAIASIVLAEAEVARLLPYRYPRPDMSRLGDVIDHAASHGARIVNLSLTSLDREEWAGFEQAAIRHPEILFVVAAGNDNRDIDRRPVYPAALALDNLITVTAARADGHLARGVNWGPRKVDLMVEADGMLALGFDGRLLPVSGSSYATARVTALAACLLAARPDSSVAMLRAQIFALARAPGAAGYVARGFIDDPGASNRGACSNGAPLSGI
jgi:subtilisin family serine protease